MSKLTIREGTSIYALPESGDLSFEVVHSEVLSDDQRRLNLDQEILVGLIFLEDYAAELGLDMPEALIELKTKYGMLIEHIGSMGRAIHRPETQLSEVYDMIKRHKATMYAP